MVDKARQTSVGWGWRALRWAQQSNFTSSAQISLQMNTIRTFYTQAITVAMVDSIELR